MNRFLPFLFLFGCHMIAAEEAIVDRCDLLCSQYMICRESHASGMSEMPPCVKPMPPCACHPVPEVEPKAAIVNQCDTMCHRYLDCLTNQAEGGSDFKTCMKPLPPCQCPSMPAAAPKAYIDLCGTMCMHYATCVEKLAAGKSEGQTCMKPLKPCDCDDKQIQPVPCVHCNEQQRKLPDNPIIHPCDVACERFSRCRAEKSDIPCLMPPSCVCTQPEIPKAVVMPMLPNLCVPCYKYWMCRRTRMGQSPELCDKPQECTCDMHACFVLGICEVDNMPEQLSIKKKIPCMKPDCNPDKDADEPLSIFCNAVCNSYKKCLSENQPEGSCFLPPGCKCGETSMVAEEKVEAPRPVKECMEPCKFYWECRLGEGHVEKPELACAKPPGCVCESRPAIAAKAMEDIPREEHCAIEVCGQYWNCQVEKIHQPDKQGPECVKPQGCKCECLDEGVCALKRFMPQQVVQVPKGVQADITEQCTNEQCADYWMCTWTAMPDDKLACIKPHGCRCSCVDAGICAPTPLPEINHHTVEAGDLRPARTEPIHQLKCAYACAGFSACLKVNGPDRCRLTPECNCGMQPVLEKHPPMGD
uniref:Uncharacterized protein n=1 Tax=Plectus sambesii TaxID=2011161 RepID=A0A914V7K2_9BILA